MGPETKVDQPNPYDWRGDRPKHFVRRTALLERARQISEGGEGVFLLLGTRGMGKSAFLAHLEADLRKNTELEVIVFSSRPLPMGPTLAVRDIVHALRDRLIDCAKRRGRLDDELKKSLEKKAEKLWLREMFEVFLEALANDVDRVVLLYDELDTYAQPPNVGRDYFDPLEDVRKKLDGRLAIVAAGGLGLLSLRTVIGSSIFARADRKVLEPFQEDDLEALAEPFQRRRSPLSNEALAALQVLSGGNLALATYGLQSLWRVESPSPRHLTAAFEEFQSDNNDFGASIRKAIFDFDESEIPILVWKALKKAGGMIAQSELQAIRQRSDVGGAIESKDILDMLRASGFIRMEDQAWKSDPIVAEIVPSILSFEHSIEHRAFATLVERLRSDLVDAMAEIHRMTPAFYRPGSKGKKKEIQTEVMFAVALVISLGERGWKADLEPVSGAGRTDIKAHYRSRLEEESAIVEVKIWGRNDFDMIHDQITSYAAKGVTALATLTITDSKDTNWKEEFRSRCLAGKVDGVPVWKPLEPPLEGYYEARSGSHLVEHFLLRLASRS
jgi:hypothetical protein